MIIIWGVCCGMVFPFAGMATEWKKVGEQDGITGFTRPTPKSCCDEVLAFGIIDAPVQAVESIIRDPETYKDFMFMCQDTHPVDIPGMESAGDVKHIRFIMGMPFPVKDRDAIFRIEYTIDKASNTLYYHIENLATDHLASDKMVRAPLVSLDYRLRPLGPARTEFTYLGLADPGGKLPAALVNTLTKNIGTKTIANLREILAQNPQKDIPALVTATPVKSHSLIGCTRPADKN